MKMNETIFDKLLRDETDRYVVWEDADHIAFLTPYPNTKGLTIVIPKVNPGDYIFAIDDDVYIKLMEATKKVARILEKALDTKRVALVFEGTGVAYVHAKLYPLYGEFANQTNVWSDGTDFRDEYQKYITTIEGPRMSDKELKAVQAKIVSVQ